MALFSVWTEISFCMLRVYTPLVIYEETEMNSDWTEIQFFFLEESFML